MTVRTPKWSVTTLPDGQYGVTYRGQAFSDPKPSKAAAELDMERCQVRYPGESAGALLEARERLSRRRGGTWRLSYEPHGYHDRVEVSASSRKEARELLLRKLKKSRLPAGSTLQLV